MHCLVTTQLVDLNRFIGNHICMTISILTKLDMRHGVKVIYIYLNILKIYLLLINGYLLITLDNGRTDGYEQN